MYRKKSFLLVHSPNSSSVPTSLREYHRLTVEEPDFYWNRSEKKIDIHTYFSETVKFLRRLR